MPMEARSSVLFPQPFGPPEHRDLPRREAQADVLYYRAVTVSGA